MKKLIVIGLALLITVPVLAAVSKATLINSSGDKVVVEVGSVEAQKYFGRGYSLMGATSDPITCKCDELGANSGPNHYNRQYFYKGFNSGGDYYASSTSVSATLSASEIDGDVFLFDYTPNVSSTLTLPASTTLDRVIGTRPGDNRTYLFRNASTTAAATFTLAAGTGIDLQDNEDSADLAIAGLDVAYLDFIRLSGGNVMVIVREYTEAD